MNLTRAHFMRVSHWNCLCCLTLRSHKHLSLVTDPRSTQQCVLLGGRKGCEWLIPVPIEETKSVCLKHHWWKINQECNLSCAATTWGIRHDNGNLIISERSDLVCNVILRALKDYEEMSHTLKLKNRAAGRGARTYVFLKLLIWVILTPVQGWTVKKQHPLGFCSILLHNESAIKETCCDCCVCLLVSIIYWRFPALDSQFQGISVYCQLDSELFFLKVFSISQYLCLAPV